MSPSAPVTGLYCRVTGGNSDLGLAWMRSFRSGLIPDADVRRRRVRDVPDLPPMPVSWISLEGPRRRGWPGARSLFYQKGQAVGQCSIQAPDQTCSIHMQEQLHRLGQGEGQGWGTGTIGRPQHPYQDAWALGSAASTRTRRQTTGRLPHCWNPIPLARKKDGTKGTESGQSTALDLYRVGTALPTEGPSLIPRTAQP